MARQLKDLSFSAIVRDCPRIPPALPEVPVKTGIRSVESGRGKVDGECSRELGRHVRIRKKRHSTPPPRSVHRGLVDHLDSTSSLVIFARRLTSLSKPLPYSCFFTILEPVSTSRGAQEAPRQLFHPSIPYRWSRAIRLRQCCSGFDFFSLLLSSELWVNRLSLKGKSRWLGQQLY